MNTGSLFQAMSSRRVSNGFGTDDEVMMVRHLTRRVELLMLVCQAQWELLRDRTGLTEEELTAKVAEVDLRDGSEDGRIGTAVADCRSCGRTGNARREFCLYCGERMPRQEAFGL
jgi:hypothetical protein